MEGNRRRSGGRELAMGSHLIINLLPEAIVLVGLIDDPALAIIQGPTFQLRGKGTGISLPEEDSITDLQLKNAAHAILTHVRQCWKIG